MEQKGTVRLNPTNMAMKSSGIRAVEEQVRGMQKASPRGAVKSDRPAIEMHGHEEAVIPQEHPAMQTRQSHHSEHKHADGRKHEDHHHAVRKLKGK